MGAQQLLHFFLHIFSFLDFAIQAEDTLTRSGISPYEAKGGDERTSNAGAWSSSRERVASFGGD